MAVVVRRPLAVTPHQVATQLLAVTQHQLERNVILHQVVIQHPVALRLRALRQLLKLHLARKLSRPAFFDPDGGFIGETKPFTFENFHNFLRLSTLNYKYLN